MIRGVHMSIGLNLEQLDSQPFIFITGNEINKAGRLFLELTGYDSSDVVGKDADFVLKNLLRLYIDREELSKKTGPFYIFTRKLEFREVEIETVYIQEAFSSALIFKECFTRFEDKNIYLEQIYNAGISGIAVYSVPDMILLKANQKYLDFLEVPFNDRQNSLGRRIDEVVTDWKGSPVEKFWMEAIITGKTVQVKEYEHKGFTRGLTYWESIITPIKENGKIKYVVGNTQEITEKVLAGRKIEAQASEVKKQKEQMDAIMENMTEALYIFDKYGNYILINKAGRDYIGGSIEKAGDSLKMVDYYELDGRRLQFTDTPIYHALNGRTVEEKVVLMKSKDKEIYTSISGSPIFDANGDLLYGVVTKRNVTDKILHEEKMKQHQELILKSERLEKQMLESTMKMKDEFLATITHEFKTPLTVINAALQTIESFYANQISDKLRKHLQRIRINSYRQLRLVNNLLDITKYNAGHFKLNKKNIDIIYLSEAIVKSVDLYARQKGVTLKFTASHACREMAIDDEKYERILLNLLSNAIKFTEKGKVIHIDVSCKNNKAVISVKDEGIGIPKSKLKMIFERFGQVDSPLSRQAEGTGIGLSLVNTLVSAMGGMIAVNSKVGDGSTFTVTLPISRLREKKNNANSINLQDNRVMQAAAIEFSDIYLE